MPRLEHLRKDLLDMSADELRDKIRAIREDRKLRKEAPKTRKARVQTKDKAKTKIAAILDSLSPKEREAFLKELEG